MSRGTGSFGARLKTLREAAGFTQEELATIAGLSVHAVSALERGKRRRPQAETVRALSAALDLTGADRDELFSTARGPERDAAIDEPSGVPLPLALTVLLGREADLEALGGWLADPAARLITLTGPGGVGKTRLALEVARAVAAEGATRVVLVPLAAVRNPEFVAQAIAEGLGLPDVTALDLPKRARVACTDRPTLLVLDNFEQVLDAAPLVAELLTSVVPLRLLVTSRAPLRVQGEREYPVGSLALAVDPEATSTADLANAPAVRLFVERVRDVQPDFRITTANGPTVAAICRRLDALPLALQLAAPWIKVLSVEDLLRRLTQNVLLSPIGARDLPDRQRTMNATVAWSYQLLDPKEQRAFRRWAALPERFSIEAAAAVLAGGEGCSAGSDEAIAAAAGLIDKSLLLRAETSLATRPLYQMLETVRAYAALELAEAGERDDAWEGLARYCSSEAALATEGLLGSAQAEWLDRVRDDLEIYRTGLAGLIERDRADEASHIAWGLMLFWVIRGHTAEGLRWYELTLNLRSRSPAAESRALLGAAFMRYTRGELAPARTGLLRVLSLAHGAGEADMVVQAENLFGYVEHALGNFDEAREHFTRSFKGFQASTIPWGAGNALSGQAAVALATGDVRLAERLLDEAASELRRSGPWFLLLPLYLRAILAVRRGDSDEAIGLARESLTRIRDLHDKYEFVYALVPLAAAAVLRGDDVWAARILGARDAVTETTGATVVDESVHDLRQRAELEVRTRLGPDRWNRAYSAGRVTSIDSLLTEIDGVLRRPADA